MSSSRVDSNLAGEISDLRAGMIKHADANQILDVVNTIIESMNRDVPSIDVSFQENLNELAGFIRDTKSEIMELSPEEISDEHLPVASMELDAIVEATETATNSIMEAAEEIEAVGADLGGDAEMALTDATMKIYEACGFQDITGQRISRVVGALNEIEAKVGDLLAAFSDDNDDARAERQMRRDDKREKKKSEARVDGEVLEGPQLTKNAVNQNDIDSLFDSLG
jgi:chemotaxis protein CheZ